MGKDTVTGHEIVAAIILGHVDPIPRDHLFWGEFDDRRNMRIVVNMIGGQARPNKSMQTIDHTFVKIVIRDHFQERNVEGEGAVVQEFS